MSLIIAQTAEGYSEPFDTAVEEEWLHAQTNSESSPEAINEHWVNVSQHARPGVGAYNEQPFQTSRTVHAQHPQSEEQGWGLDPGRRWAHYPFEENTNPYWDSGQYMRNGTDAYIANVYRPEQLYVVRMQEARDLGWQSYRQRGPVAPVVPLPESVPFVSTVPSYGGGPEFIPGIDLPVDPSLFGPTQAGYLEQGVPFYEPAYSPAGGPPYNPSGYANYPIPYGEGNF